MKALLPIIPAIALISGLQAEKDKEVAPYHAVQIANIEAKFHDTPEFQVKGLENKDQDVRQWVEIEAELDIITNKTGGLPRTLPELKVNWHAMVKDKVTKKDKKVDLSVKLMGVSTYKNVRLEDGKLYLNAFIEPDTLERYFGDGRMRANDFKFGVTLHGEGIKVFGEKAETWNNWQGKYLDQAIVAKSKTPFALLWLDRYPAEKLVQ